MRVCKMRLSEVERSPQPTAARQSSIPWTYERHGRLEDSRANWACSFASVVVPLFWKAKLDRLQFPSSAGNPQQRTNHFPQKSVTTEDLAVLGIPDTGGASRYDNHGKGSVCRGQGGQGVLTAVRSEGDLRCKYSAALSSSRRFDADAEILRRGAEVRRDVTASKALSNRDTEAQRFSRRAERCRRVGCEPHYTLLRAGKSEWPQPFTSAQRFCKENTVHSYVSAIAEGADRDGYETPTPGLLPPSASSQRMHRSRHAVLPSESPKKSSVTGTLQRVVHRDGDVFQGENSPQHVCSLRSQSRSEFCSSVNQDQEATRGPLAKNAVEDLSRVQVEKAHNRMREHMTDMLRFLDRIQAKHAHRRTTAAFRLRAARSSDGPGALSYAALHCLAGITGCATSRRESSLTAAAATCGVATAETLEAAPLRRLAGGAAAEVKGGDLAGRGKPSVAEEQVHGGGKCPRESVKHNALATDEEKRAETGIRSSAYTAKIEQLTALPGNRDTTTALRTEEAAGAEAAAAKRKLRAARSPALSVRTKKVVDAHVLTETSRIQGTLAAEHAKSLVAAEEIPRPENTATTEGGTHTIKKSDSGASGRVTGRRETAPELGALKNVEASSSKEEVLAGWKRGEGRCGDGSVCASPRRRRSSRESGAALAKDGRHSSAAAQGGRKWIWAATGVHTVETANGKEHIRKAVQTALTLTEENADSVEQHKIPGTSATDRGHEARCEGRSLCERQRMSRVAAADTGRVLFEELSPGRSDQREANPKQVERSPDVTILRTAVVKVHSGKDSGRHDFGEAVEEKQNDFDDALVDPDRAAKRTVTEAFKREDAARLQQLRTSLRVMHQVAEGDADAALGEGATQVPTPLQSRAEARADLQTPENHKYTVKLEGGDEQWQRQPETAKDYNADRAGEAVSVLRHHTVRTLEGRPVEEVEQHSSAIERGEKSCASGKAESRTLESAGAAHIGDKAHAISLIEQEIIERNIHAIMKEEQVDLPGYEAPTRERPQLHPVETNACAEQRGDIGIQNEGNRHEAERTRPTLEGASDSESHAARTHEAKMESTMAPESAILSAGTEAGRVNPAQRKSASARVSCFESHSLAAATDDNLACTAPSLCCEAEAPLDASNGARSKTRSLTGSRGAAQNVGAGSGALRGVVSNVENSQTASTAGSAPFAKGVKTSRESSLVAVPLLRAISGWGRTPGFIGRKDGIIEARQCRRGDATVEGSLKTEREKCDVTGNGVNGLNGTCMKPRPDSYHKSKASVQGSDPQLQIGVSTDTGCSLEHHAAYSLEEKNHPAGGEPTHARGIEGEKNTAYTSSSHEVTDGAIIRLGSKTSTVPSSFGTLHLSSQEDFIEEEGPQTSLLAIGETDSLPLLDESASKAPDEAPPAPAPVLPMGIPAARAAKRGPVPDSKTETGISSSTDMERKEAQKPPSAATGDRGLAVEQVHTLVTTEERCGSAPEAAGTFMPVWRYTCDPRRSSGPQDVSGHMAGSRSTRATNLPEGEGIGGSATTRTENATTELPDCHSLTPAANQHFGNDNAGSTAGRVCEACVGKAIEELWPSVATPVAPFLRKRGPGGAYATKDLLMLSGGYWYRKNCEYSFRLPPPPLHPRDPAYVASRAAGMRARAIQQNLLLSIQREVRLSRRRVRSMYYWPNSFVHACASAVLTKATMVAAGSFVAPLCHCSPQSEGCRYCLPDTSLPVSPRDHLKFTEGNDDPRSWTAEIVSPLHCPCNSGEGSLCPCRASRLSLEKLALMDSCCWCDRAAHGDSFKNQAAKASSEKTQQQHGGSAARLGRHGLCQEATPLQHSQRFNKRPQTQPPRQKARTQRRRGEAARSPAPLVHRGFQRAASAPAVCLDLCPPAFMQRRRPPLIVRWSLADADVVEVAGTFSRSPWKDVYRMEWDRSLRGFALDLYSVAPHDMLMQQERFTGLRVDDRHKHVLSRGWWVCPLYPRAKEEAVLQIAVKFRVDGVWRCEPLLPIHRDDQGRAVNLLVVYQGQHVTSPQVGQTQYFFKGLDLSPVTYNPSRSPAYQEDGPVLMQPSAEDIHLDDVLMSLHRRCWNPPSSRPLMATPVPLETQAPPFSHSHGAGGAAYEGNVGENRDVETAEKASGGEEGTGDQDANQKAADEEEQARDDGWQADEGDRNTGEVHCTVGCSGGPGLPLPQTTGSINRRARTARHAERDEQERQQQELLVTDGCCEAAEEVPSALPATQKFEFSAGGTERHPAKPSQQEEEETLLQERNSQVCGSDREQEGQLGNENGVVEEEGGDIHEVGGSFQRNQWTERDDKHGEPLILVNKENGDGKDADRSPGNRVGGVQRETPEEESEDIPVQVQRGQNSLIDEGEISHSRETAATHFPAGPVPSRQHPLAADTPERLPTANAGAVATGAATATLSAFTSNLWGGAQQAGIMPMEAGDKEHAMKGESIQSAKQEQGTAEGSIPSQELDAQPRDTAASPTGGVYIANAPERACGRRDRGGTTDERDLMTAAEDRQASVAVSEPPAGAAEGKEQRPTTLSVLKEGQAATAVSTPRLNRGFSAYGSTLGVTEEGSTLPTADGYPPVSSAATGGLRRVSTLGNSYWPNRVTRHLQKPDVFHELGRLDVAGRRTPAEGARKRRGLTMQCGSYMIPHPDKTESGGADAFFIATPVPPSSRYFRRFACADVPLARSSTPPLRSIPPSRQRRRYSEAGNGKLKDSSNGASTWGSSHCGEENYREASSTTGSTVVSSPFLTTPSCHFSFDKTSSPDSSSSTNIRESASPLSAGSLPDTFTKRHVGANCDGDAEVTAEGEGRPRQSLPQAGSLTVAKAYSGDSGAIGVFPNETAYVAPCSAEPPVASCSPHTVGASAAVSSTSPASAAFLSGAAAFTEVVESPRSFEIDTKSPEDEASAIQMLLREALEENSNSGLAQVLSACPSQKHGGPPGDAAEESHESGTRYSVSSSFVCAGAAVCTPPHRPAGAPVMTAGGYGSSPKGIIIGSGGEMGGAVCVGIADGVGEWDSFGLNPRLFAEELMRGCWEAAHESWFWEVPAVEHRALEVLKRGYKAARSFGSCTALVACLDTRSEKMGIANLGDSGIIILRRQHQSGMIYNKMTCVHRSREQQHNFNCPYQLSCLPSPSQYQQLADDGKQSLVRVLRSATMLPQDTPEMADVYTVNTLEGDLVLLGTDGLFDNLFDHEICALANAALSPYEAALLNNETLATSADAVAAAIAEAAAHKSRDPLAKTPFMRHARRAQTHFVGGKMDDITVVACWVTRGQLPPDYLTDESECA